MVLAEGISAQDFYELASEYGVSGVPDTVINGKGRVVGAVPEKQMLSQLMKQFNK